MVDVREVRRVLDLTQRELADLLSVSQSTVAKWERAELDLTAEQRAALIRVLGERPVPGLWPDRGRSDTYPAAPAGGGPGTDEALERRVFMADRNARIAHLDPEAQVTQTELMEREARERRAKGVKGDG